MNHVSSQWSRRVAAGVAATAVLGSLLAGAGTALADDPGVPINVNVQDAGALSMSVDLTPVTLAENGSDDDIRRFTGDLPVVTVTDTRLDIPEDTWWAVVGQTSDFVNATDPTKIIPGGYLGWTPELINGPVDDTVLPGTEVESIADGGVGLEAGFELLFFSDTATAAAENRTEWKADADLELAVPFEELEPGAYSATLTLSLFEDAI